MKNFNKTFYTLVIFFIFYFYILPLIVISNVEDSGLSYYSYQITNEKIIFAFFSICIFLLGFFIFDILKLINIITIRKKNQETLVNYKVSKFFWILLFVYLIFLVFQLFDTNRGMEIYEIRRGIKESNHFSFFIINVFSGIKFVLFLIIFNYFEKKNIFLILIISTYVEFLGGIGRVSMLVNLAMIIMLLFNIKSFSLAKMSYIILLFFLPIILYLKSVIYIFSTGDGNLSLSDFTFDYDLFISNFSHPLISLINSETLIDKLGYRYLYDYLQGFLFYFKIIGLDFGDSLTYYNSENLIGIYGSIVPPGYIAFGYIQLSFIGIYFSGIFFRFIGYLAKKILILYSNKSEELTFLLAFMAANSFYHGEIRIMVMTLFFPFILALIFHPLLLKKGN